MAKRVINSKPFMMAVCEQMDMDPETVGRIVIDAVPGEPLKLYVTQYGTEELLDVKLPGPLDVQIHMAGNAGEGIVNGLRNDIDWLDIMHGNDRTEHK